MYYSSLMRRTPHLPNRKISQMPRVFFEELESKMTVICCWYLLCELTICGIKPYMKVKIQYFKIPPITVFISDACPGQSTNVYCTTPCPVCVRWLGTSTWTEEKPKSSVMPRSRLCGFLSKLAVLAVVLRTFDKLVLPLSTWPKTPTLKLNMEAAILVRFVVSRDVTCITLYRI